MTKCSHCDHPVLDHDRQYGCNHDGCECDFHPSKIMKNKCVECGSPDLEHWGDGDYSDRCGRCNDRQIEYSNRSREWAHYHPGEPMPESER